MVQDERKAKTQSGWDVTPEAFYDVIKWVNDTYHPKSIIVTENGCGSNDWLVNGHVDDANRCAFLEQYLINLHRAIQDGIPVDGYFVWSLFDNFELSQGLTIRFGLVYIDYETLERTPKRSAYWFSDVIRNNRIIIQ